MKMRKEIDAPAASHLAFASERGLMYLRGLGTVSRERKCENAKRKDKHT